MTPQISGRPSPLTKLRGHKARLPTTTYTMTAYISATVICGGYERGPITPERMTPDHSVLGSETNIINHGFGVAWH
jgi:hypothetical protein